MKKDEGMENMSILTDLVSDQGLLNSVKALVLKFIVPNENIITAVHINSKYMHVP